LHFAQYSADQIISIIKERLVSLNSVDSETGRQWIDQSAVELCARKIATVGDFRKALDICK
jgi:Cdc6-like AAA superfamily ATPase